MARPGRQPRCSDEEFIELFTMNGPEQTAKQLKVSLRGVYSRRRDIENRVGHRFYPPSVKSNFIIPTHPSRLQFQISDGTVLIGSDAHVWPDDRTTAQTAFIQFAKKLQPDLLILNGDVLDGATVSRHAAIGWESRPSLEEELEAVTAFLDDLEKAAPNSKKVWALGNHDARFETKLANVVPEYAGIKGVHLKDHFPNWQACWSIWINDDVVVKHRYKGGHHATHQNTVNSGKTIITGHLHSLKCTPFTDYNGTRFGVDTGTLADPLGQQFMDYTEDNPKNWRSGFAVLTFHKDTLLWPELVHTFSNTEVEFRGEVIKI